MIDSLHGLAAAVLEELNVTLPQIFDNKLITSTHVNVVQLKNTIAFPFSTVQVIFFSTIRVDI